MYFSGYSCEDHFLEPDSYLHSWEVLIEIMTSPLCENMLIDIGMPVQHRNVSYNCRVIFLNKKIILIRPKMANCDNGCYRETRYFTPWTKVSIYSIIQLSIIFNYYLSQFNSTFENLNWLLIIEFTN